MSNINFDAVLDAKGLSCPMPLIKSRQEMNHLTVDQTLKVLATDRGSIKDIEGWVKTSDNLELIAQETEEENGKTIYIHYVKKIK